MRSALSPAALVALWVGFFASSVYGHAALKLAVGSRRGLVAAAMSAWGVSAFAAWTLSGILWMAVLEAHPLLRASSISSLRYVFVCASAWMFLGERMGPRDALGVALIALCVSLVARG